MRKKKMVTGLLVSLIFLIGPAPRGIAASKGPNDFVDEARARITELSAAQVKADLDAGKQVILLDVRDSEEYEIGHLPNAVNVSRGMLEFEIGRVIGDRYADIVVYCRTGARSALATYVLNQMGYEDAKNMSGGFKAWGTAGYPIYNRHGEFKMTVFELRK